MPASGFYKLGQFFNFGLEPDVERAAGFQVRAPKAVGPLFNLALHAQMLLGGEFSLILAGRGGRGARAGAETRRRPGLRWF